MSSRTTTNVLLGTVVGPTLVETRPASHGSPACAFERGDRLELLDLLADAVLVEDEVLSPEIEDGTALLVDDTDVDLNDVGLRLEPRPGRTGRGPQLSGGRVATERRETGAPEKDGERQPVRRERDSP